MSIHGGEAGHSSFPPPPPPPSKRLRMVIREEEKDGNLFVRLSSPTAFDLYCLAMGQSNGLSASCQRTPEDAWTMLDGETSSSISFLPLCILIGDNAPIFASYNGGAVISSSGQDTIEVPSTLLSGVSNFPEFVSVHALTCIQHGTQVLVEPATVEDWELLEIYGNSVEEGGLLGQLSVVYPNQQLSITVKGIDRVKIKVAKVTTRASSKLKLENDVHPVWPDVSLHGIGLTRKRSQKEDESPRCVLLVRDTEMIVKPKARLRKKIFPWLDPFRLIPSDVDWGESYKKLSKLTGRSSFHVEPGCVLVAIEQWPFEFKWAQVRPENSNTTRIVRVMTSSRISRDNAVLHPITRFDLHLSIHRDCIHLRPLSSMREEPLENILLEEIYLEYGRKSSATWNVPDIDLANSFDQSNFPTNYIRGDQCYFPVGAVIPMPIIDSSKYTNCRVERWFRITSNDKSSNNAGRIVRVDSKRMSYLFESRLRRLKELSDSLLVSNISTILRPRNIILSSDWTKPIIDRMKKFRSLFITLRGVRGSGKTHSALLLSTLASFHFHRPMFYLDCKMLQKLKPRMNGILEEIDSLFARALEARDPIIVLDDLDNLSPNLLGGAGNDVSERTHSVNPAAVDQSKLIGDRLSHLIEAAVLRRNDCGDRHLFLIATCSSADSINPSIIEFSRAPTIHIKVPFLSAEDRSDLLMAMMHRQITNIRLSFDRSDISRRTEGFLPRDIEKITLRALRSYRGNRSATSLQDTLVAELTDFTPIAQISNLEDQDQYHTSWEDIGGLFEVKETLDSIVRRPLLYRRIYARARVQLPRGILLYGPSGCGKSYLVPALARECNYSIVTCKGPEVLDKYIGASEAKVRELFERAAQMAPSILFLDELEALAPRRGTDSTGVTDRVVNQLLTFLDGVEDFSSSLVFIIGATSRPDKVDAAILRPGRLERHLYIGPPDSADEWSDLLTKISKNWNLKPESLLSISTGGEITKMMNTVSKLCPADIRAAFDTAHLNAVHRKLTGDIPSRDIKEIQIDVEDIKFGLRETNPSLSENETRILESIYNSFGGRKNTNPKGNLHELKTSLR